MELVDWLERATRPVAARGLVVVQIVWRDLAIQAQVTRGCRRLDAEAGFDVPPAELAREERAQLQKREALALGLRNIQWVGQKPLSRALRPPAKQGTRRSERGYHTHQFDTVSYHQAMRLHKKVFAGIHQQSLSRCKIRNFMRKIQNEKHF